MCGISAIYQLDKTSTACQTTIDAMNNSQHHRGPDDVGTYFDGYVGLGHTRLEIIDIDTGQQPLVDVTDSVVVTFNGEIYNFQVLREELKAQGYSFATQSDTEVIVNAWRAWHVKCVEHFNGMFSFVLWDKTSKTLFAARDRLGIKPLHWAITQSNSLVFSSELKAIQKHCDINLAFNEQAIEDFLTLGYVIEPKSIFKNIYKIPAGHYVLVDKHTENIATKPYWEIKDFFAEKTTLDKKKLLELMNDSVQNRMISDVPLGAFLSGGLDSTLIVALMSEHSPNKINTCSIGFDLSKYDESSFAELAAKELDTEHSTTSVSVNDLSLVDLLVDVFGEPFADNSAIPTLILSKTTRSRVKVALSGDGSDELFFGYRNYQMLNFEERIRKIMPGFLRQPIFTFLAKVYPRLNNAPRFLRAKSTLASLSQESITSHHNSMSLADKHTIESLYSLSFKAQLKNYSSLTSFKKIASEVKHHSALKQVQYVDFKTYLPSDILTKVDRASMADSLEVRVPFLDHKVVEYGVSLAPAVNIKGSKVKVALVKAFKHILPKFVIERKKMGFTAPIDEWIRQIPIDTLERRLLSEPLLSQNIFNVLHLKQLIIDHHKRKRDNGVLIWALLILEAFFRKNNPKK